MGGDFSCRVVQSVASALTGLLRAAVGQNKLHQSQGVILPPRSTMRVLLLLCMPAVLLAQAQYQEPYPLLEDYGPDYLTESSRSENGPGSYQQQTRLDTLVRPEKSESDLETEPTEPTTFDCREEQYPCTRLYSVHKPCKQCLNSICFYSLRRVYVINKEICVRTVCAHEELLRADLCRDQFSRCGVAAVSGQCASLGGSCGKSCGGC
ncbi:microfibrillar-associated protein 2 [Gouania willdenowi]|nr:microfibrillar-associated protein 2 [Gouania willdenowi]